MFLDEYLGGVKGGGVGRPDHTGKAWKKHLSKFGGERTGTRKDAGRVRYA